MYYVLVTVEDFLRKEFEHLAIFGCFLSNICSLSVKPYRKKMFYAIGISGRLLVSNVLCFAYGQKVF